MFEIILDCEASGLSDESYPIEIGWVNKDLIYLEEDSFLIRPHETWTYWDEYAEKQIHHISREQLFDEGISVKEACERLISKIGTKEYVYSDAPPYERMWLNKLFRVVGKERPFGIKNVINLISPKDDSYFYTNVKPVKHRALDDARQIAERINRLQL